MDDIESVIIKKCDIIRAAELLKELYHTQYIFSDGIEKEVLLINIKKYIQKMLEVILKDTNNKISYEDCVYSSNIIKSMSFEKEYVLFLFTILKKFGGNSYDWEYAGNELENHFLFEESGECFYFSILLTKKENIPPIDKLERLIELWKRRAKNYEYRKRFIDQEAAEMMIQHLNSELEQLKKNQEKIAILETQYPELPKKVDKAYQQLLKKRENRINYQN